MTHRIFTGVLPNGDEILVQLWSEPEEYAEAAFRRHHRDTWGPPVELHEEPA